MSRAGKFPAVITACDVTMSTNDNERVCLQFIVEDPEGEFPITWFGALTDAAMKWTAEALIAVGWNPYERVWKLSEIDGVDTLVGRAAFLTIEEDVYEGKTRLVVAWVNAAGGFIGEKLADDKKVGLRERLMAASVKSGEMQPEAVVVGDDDVPF